MLTLILLDDELALDDVFCVAGGIVSISAVDIVVISKKELKKIREFSKYWVYFDLWDFAFEILLIKQV